MKYPAKIVSSVLFVSELERSLAFYRPIRTPSKCPARF